MRPRGEIRQALATAAHALAGTEQQGGTWRDMAAHACVGFGKAKEVVRNMARHGELEPCGTVRTPHARRPMVKYRPARGGFVNAPLASLDGAMSAWYR